MVGGWLLAAAVAAATTEVWAQDGQTMVTSYLAQPQSADQATANPQQVAGSPTVATLYEPAAQSPPPASANSNEELARRIADLERRAAQASQPGALPAIRPPSR